MSRMVHITDKYMLYKNYYGAISSESILFQSDDVSVDEQPLLRRVICFTLCIYIV